jgi:hypothetical protein
MARVNTLVCVCVCVCVYIYIYREKREIEYGTCIIEHSIDDGREILNIAFINFNYLKYFTL